MTLLKISKETRDGAIERINTLLFEVGSSHRYGIWKTPATYRDALHMIESDGLAALKGDTKMYEQLTDNAEIYFATRVLEGLIESLQEEGLLRKK